MTTLGGQQFKDAYAALYRQLNAGTAPGSVSPSTVLRGGIEQARRNLLQCFSSCTAAVATSQSTNVLNTDVSAVWTAINSAKQLDPRRTMISQSSMVRWPGNYAQRNHQHWFLKLQRDVRHPEYSRLAWLSASPISPGPGIGYRRNRQYNSSNTTLDAWNNKADYGLQNFDVKLLFNSGLAFQPRSFFGLSDFRNKKASWVIWSKVGRSLRS